MLIFNHLGAAAQTLPQDLVDHLAQVGPNGGDQSLDQIDKSVDSVVTRIIWADITDYMASVAAINWSKLCAL